MAYRTLTVDLDLIRKCIRYEPETGKFFRLMTAGNSAIGSVAGWPTSNGYLAIQVAQQTFKAHRLAFLLMTGEMPKEQIDHINGNRSDNRWCNLRACTNHENAQNLRCAKSSNKSSGLLGAFWHKKKKKWQSQIRIDGSIKHLGYFESAIDAHHAYVEAKRMNHSFCTI